MKHEEVVVVNMRALDACRAQRLRSIVISSRRDVIVLLNKGAAIRPGLVKISGLPLESYVRKPDVPKCMYSFSSQTTSRGSKAAALIWFNTTSYKRMWLLEDDAFFSGSWGTLFDGVSKDSKPWDSDLVAHFGSQRLDWPWWTNGCEVAGRSCAGTSNRTATYWFVIRISRKFSNFIVDSFCDGDPPLVQNGFHEAVTYSLCALPKANCTSQPLSKRWFSNGFLPGSWGAFRTDKSLSTLQGLTQSVDGAGLAPFHLYHPAKCESDTKVGPLSIRVARYWQDNSSLTVATTIASAIKTAPTHALHEPELKTGLSHAKPSTGVSRAGLISNYKQTLAGYLGLNLGNN